MQNLPDIYHVSPEVDPAEYGVVSFIREVVRLFSGHVGPSARPVSVLGLTSAEAGSDGSQRWTVVYVALIDGSHVTFVAQPPPAAAADTEWRVYVNGRFIEVLSPPSRRMRERLASAAARGLRQASTPPPQWGPFSPPQGQS